MKAKRLTKEKVGSILSAVRHFNFNADAEQERPAGGNANLICEAFGRAGHEERVEQLLRVDLLEDELPDVSGELERHAALAAELGMPGFVAGVCYSSIPGDHLPAEFIPAEFEGIRFEAVNSA